MQEIDDIDIDIDGTKPKSSPKVQPKEKDNKQVILDSPVTAKEEEQQPIDEKFTKRGRKLDNEVMVKICDMGNGCWTHHHFTPEIQTR